MFSALGQGETLYAPPIQEHPYKEECKTGKRNGYTAERPATVKVK